MLKLAVRISFFSCFSTSSVWERISLWNLLFWLDCLATEPLGSSGSTPKYGCSITPGCSCAGELNFVASTWPTKPSLQLLVAGFLAECCMYDMWACARERYRLKIPVCRFWKEQFLSGTWSILWGIEFFTFCFVLTLGLVYLRMTLKSWDPCFVLPRVEIAGLCYHAWHKY